MEYVKTFCSAILKTLEEWIFFEASENLILSTILFGSEIDRQFFPINPSATSRYYSSARKARDFVSFVTLEMTFRRVRLSPMMLDVAGKKGGVKHSAVFNDKTLRRSQAR